MILFEIEMDSDVIQEMETTLKLEKLYVRSQYGLQDCVLRI